MLLHGGESRSREQKLLKRQSYCRAVPLQLTAGHCDGGATGYRPPSIVAQIPCRTTDKVAVVAGPASPAENAVELADVTFDTTPHAPCWTGSR